MRGSRIRFVRGRRDVGAGRRTSSRSRGRRPGEAVHQGLPRRRCQSRRHGSQDQCDPAAGRSAHLRRARPGRVAISRRPAASYAAGLGHLPARAPDHPAGCCATSLGHRRGGLRTTVVRYQPEASATLRLEVDRTVDRPCSPSISCRRVDAIAARHQALWSTIGSAQPLRIAEPLAADPVRRVLWTRGVSGRPLAEAVDPDRAARAPRRRMGALLAAFHGSSVPSRRMSLSTACWPEAQRRRRS